MLITLAILFIDTILQVDYSRNSLGMHSIILRIIRQCSPSLDKYQNISPSVYPKYAGYLRAKLSIQHTFRGSLFYIFELFTFHTLPVTINIYSLMLNSFVNNHLEKGNIVGAM